jgi:hypothetical protein
MVSTGLTFLKRLGWTFAWAVEGVFQFFTRSGSAHPRWPHEPTDEWRERDASARESERQRLSLREIWRTPR